MSKIDVITKCVIDLNRIIDSLVGFQGVIPEGTDDDCFNIFVRSSLEKLELDLSRLSEELLRSV